MESRKRFYTIKAKKEEALGITTLFLVDENGGVPYFSSGQYITVYFLDSGNRAVTRDFSISSAPGEPRFSITVHSIGKYSSYLCSLSVGEKILASPPYGFFGIGKRKSEIVLIAGGIGITPFRSMLLDMSREKFQNRVYLFHSIRMNSSAIFKKEFNNLEAKFDNFLAFYFVTRESSADNSKVFHRRIDVADILSKLTSPHEAEFLICGSLAFTREIKRLLHGGGINEENLHTEAFFSY